MIMEYVIDPDKISIITPFYNPGDYLTECIHSIIDQSYQNWELLLVNDHSTDKSHTIAQNFLAKDERIKLFENSTKGLIPALRLAYSNSTGNFITRMDADDVMHPQKLETMIKRLKECGPGSVCVGKVKYFSDTELGDGYLKYENWLNDLTEHETNFEGIYRECSIPSPNFLISREDFDRIGGFNNDNYPEDYDLAFRMYQHNLDICSVKEVTHNWRDHSTRSTRTQDHYQPLSFIPLKLKYFLKIDYKNHVPLVLWGAGKKGKLIAKELIKNEIDIHWITENEKKIGKDIYDIKLCSPDHINLENTQVIIAVSNPEEALEIERKLCSNEQSSYWRFF